MVWPPTYSAVKKCVKNWATVREPRGRPQGTRETTKADDKLIVKTMLQIRGPKVGGLCYLKHIRARLPARLQDLSLELIRLRLKEAGYKGEDKILKEAPSEKNRKKRLAFAKEHLHRTPQGWLDYLQAVGDMKNYGWYPKRLQNKHKTLRVKRTYMKKSEKYKPGFLRPEAWFSRKDWKDVKQVKMLAFTCSTGATWAAICPTPWDNIKFADLIEKEFAPWIKAQLPEKREIRLLLDGERLMHAPQPKKVFKEQSLTVLPNWPPRSPDLNPQENAWAMVEKRLRAEEPKKETYAHFVPRLERVQIESISSETAKNLIKSMANRMEQLNDVKGGRIKY